MSKARKEFTKERIRVLCAPTHERYQSYFENLPIDFLMLSETFSKKWDTNFAPIPSNHRAIGKITPDLMPDIILSQHKFGQYQLFSKIADSLKIPLVSMTHILPNKETTKDQIKKMFNMQGNYNVFLSEYSMNKWMFSKNISTIIPQCVDSDVFRPMVNVKKRKEVLSVVNEFDQREGPCNYSGWLKITKSIPTRLIGSSKSGISKPAKNIADLVHTYNSHSIFLNTSRNSTMPFTVFEAMACGSVVVSANTTMIGEVIKDGHNGFLYSIDRPEDAIYILNKLLKMDNESLEEIGLRARNTVMAKFSKDSFLESWLNVFNGCYQGA